MADSDYDLFSAAGALPASPTPGIIRAMKASAWIELQRLLDEGIANTDLATLSSIDERVLLWIFSRQQKKEPLHVQEVIIRSSIASPASLHKSLAALETAGLLKSEIDPEDQRRRVLSVTTKAEKLLESLDNLVMTWAKSGRT